ncbi:hypothetical protein [Pseudomonas savastanoi]|uniref:hypothetical protein n=1 Tax=Pseudomonas savastanoi TaxID=29438 RepID=UPI000E32CEAD|nr:hypothetical protein [Pseudomonas savastanoi]
MFSFPFLRHLTGIFLPATAETGPAAHDPGSAVPIREERYRLPLAIWFEDTSKDPDRLWPVKAVPPKGMDEEWFDAVLGDAAVVERRYVTEGLLSGAKVRVHAGDYCRFTSVLMKVSGRVGTIPWIRNLAEPDYANFWQSRKPLFPE